jgi:hypothetical protein
LAGWLQTLQAPTPEEMALFDEPLGGAADFESLAVEETKSIA